MSGALEVIQNIESNVKKVIVGKDEVIRKIICCWIAGGHCLIEDVPGTGKTILARALAKSCALDFKRVQFTPDLLPSDVIGTTVYIQSNQDFEFKPGPIFTVILLGDEINRATPRTQSALLESMSEGQVSMDGKTYKLDPLFFTIATQNPVDQLGTFTLPEAQMDRFMMKLSMGYPGPAQEIEMVKSQNKAHPLDALKPVESHERILWVKRQVHKINISPEIHDYVVSIVNHTRQSPDLKLGASPRSTIALTRAAQALALMDGLDYVRPSHVHELAPFVLSHRLILTPEAKLAENDIYSVMNRTLESVQAPTQPS